MARAGAARGRRELVTGAAAGRRDDAQITIYKAVGVGLQDVALAGLAYRRIDLS